jgi:hypothetical protein
LNLPKAFPSYEKVRSIGGEQQTQRLISPMVNVPRRRLTLRKAFTVEESEPPETVAVYENRCFIIAL